MACLLETYWTVRLETPPLHLTEQSLQSPTCQVDPEQEAAVHVLDSCVPVDQSSLDQQ